MLADNSVAIDDIQPIISLQSPEGEKSSIEFHNLLVGLEEKKITYQMVFSNPGLVSFSS